MAFDRVSARRENRPRFTSFGVGLGSLGPNSNNTPFFSLPLYTSEATAAGYKLIHHPVTAKGFFGSEDKYIVASTGISDGTSFTCAWPEITEISTPDGDVSGANGEPTNRLLTRDASAAEVHNTPLPLPRRSRAASTPCRPLAGQGSCGRPRHLLQRSLRR